jgi:hypothetical protein
MYEVRYIGEASIGFAQKFSQFSKNFGGKGEALLPLV